MGTLLKMSHSSRKDSQQGSNLPENYFDKILISQQKSSKIVSNILEEIITNGAQILHKKYIMSQIVPYASKTLARELVMNASWALEPIGPNDIIAEPDEDIEIPPIDEWAGGVLPVRSAEATGLRASAPPPRESIKSTTSSSNRPHQATTQKTHLAEQPNSEQNMRSAVSAATHRSRNASNNKNIQKETKKKPKPQISEAVAITKAFEEAKKKTSVSMKAVTVDSDFTVIQISEPKGLPPALIVPKVTTKRVAKVEQQQVVQRAVARPRIARPQTTTKKRNLPKLIEPDQPVFDEEIAEISYSDKFVPAPGVTFKDGSTVKSRAQQSNPNQMTRAQYEAYLEEMKKC